MSLFNEQGNILCAKKEKRKTQIWSALVCVQSISKQKSEILKLTIKKKGKQTNKKQYKHPRVSQSVSLVVPSVVRLPVWEGTFYLSKFSSLVIYIRSLFFIMFLREIPYGLAVRIPGFDSRYGKALFKCTDFASDFVSFYLGLSLFKFNNSTTRSSQCDTLPLQMEVQQQSTENFLNQLCGKGCKTTLDFHLIQLHILSTSVANSSKKFQTSQISFSEPLSLVSLRMKHPIISKSNMLTSSIPLSRSQSVLGKNYESYSLHHMGQLEKKRIAANRVP